MSETTERPTITPERVSEYIKKDGAFCLHCGESAIEGGPFNTEAGCAWQEITCTECGAEWQDIYLLSAIDPGNEHGETGHAWIEPPRFYFEDRDGEILITDRQYAPGCGWDAQVIADIPDDSTAAEVIAELSALDDSTILADYFGRGNN